MKPKASGTEIKYLHVCHRKLWLFHHGIRPEMENMDVQIGMLVQTDSFAREEKEIPIGDVGVLDWVDFESGEIHETKKAKSVPASDEAQVSYYMHVLNQQGVAIHRAIIHYPRQRKTRTVEWTPETCLRVENDLRQWCEVVTSAIPDASRKAICDKCAYEEICFS